MRTRGRPRPGTQHAAASTLGRQHLDPAPLRLVHQRVRRVEAHRLLVQQRRRGTPARSARAARSTGRRAGRRPPSGPSGSRSPRSRRSASYTRSADLRARRRSPSRPRRTSRSYGAHRRLRARAAHRPPQPLGLAGGEAGERHRHLDHLVLEDDRAERVLQHRLERRVLVGHLVRGRRAAPCAARCRGAPRRRWIGPGRTSATCTVRSSSDSGSVRVQHLHLRAALDLEDAHRLGALDRGVDLAGRRRGSATGRSAPRACARSRPRSARPPTASPARAGRSSGSRRPRTTPCPTAPSGGRPSRPAGSGRCRERLRRDDHPARVLRDVARQPVRLLHQPRPAPASAASSTRAAADRLRDVVARLVELHGSAERAARSTSPAAARAPCRSRAPRRATLVGGERGDERRASCP